ncbi:hypothetical protein [Bacillus cereus]|uniref:Uncharacterized protein n=1 Tax=Bacillus cereus TaxID=1396 RepID=A0ABD4LLV2_BACCE|nr:hypothetical protein [Bacillus cereus]MBK1611753.1 hypothetical protein [Bacillus cereus]
MTEIKFEIREKKVDGLLECHVYDITGENEIYAGCVKNFTWNKGLTGGGFNRLEPFDANGERLGHGGDGTDIQKLVDYVKSVHTSRVEREKRISDNWESQKEDATRLGCSEGCFKRYDNVRNYVSSVLFIEKELVHKKFVIDELVSCYESKTFSTISTEAVKIVFKEAIDKRQKEIEDSESQLERIKGWIKEYEESFNKHK